MGGEFGQEAHILLSPGALEPTLTEASPTAVVEPRGGGYGQVAAAPSSPQVAFVAAQTMAPVTPPSQRVGTGGEFGQEAHILLSPSTPEPHGVGSRQTSAGHTSRAGGLTVCGPSREEVIAFGGIADPVSER